MAEIRNYTLNFGPQHPAAHAQVNISKYRLVVFVYADEKNVFTHVINLVVMITNQPVAKRKYNAFSAIVKMRFKAKCKIFSRFDSKKEP